MLFQIIFTGRGDGCLKPMFPPHSNTPKAEELTDIPPSIRKKALQGKKVLLNVHLIELKQKHRGLLTLVTGFFQNEI